MVDVTSLHIGISINAINSCLAVAIPTSLPRPPSYRPSFLLYHVSGWPGQKAHVKPQFIKGFPNCSLSGARCTILRSSWWYDVGAKHFSDWPLVRVVQCMEEVQHTSYTLLGEMKFIWSDHACRNKCTLILQLHFSLDFFFSFFTQF